MNLDRTNYRTAAKEALDVLRERGDIVGALFWGHILGHYETALKGSLDALDRIASLGAQNATEMACEMAQKALTEHDGGLGRTK